MLRSSIDGTIILFHMYILCVSLCIVYTKTHFYCLNNMLYFLYLLVKCARHMAGCVSMRLLSIVVTL